MLLREVGRDGSDVTDPEGAMENLHEYAISKDDMLSDSTVLAQRTWLGWICPAPSISHMGLLSIKIYEAIFHNVAVY